jgi:hypothetical protein
MERGLTLHVNEKYDSWKSAHGGNKINTFPASVEK